MVFKYSLFIISAVLVSALSTSCNKNKDVQSLADSFCTCAQPIVEWKKGLEYHYEELAKEVEVRMWVDSCLTPAKTNYADKSDDIEFQKAVAEKVKEQCPEANTTVIALFKILFADTTTK